MICVNLFLKKFLGITCWNKKFAKRENFKQLDHLEKRIALGEFVCKLMMISLKSG